MVAPLEELRRKLAAREGKPGMSANVAAIKALIEEAEGTGYTYRDAATGHFVGKDYAEANPATTYRTAVR
jgi:hypothetical protein